VSSYEFKQELQFATRIQSLVEVDPANNFFAAVMEGDEGLAIIRIDFITGDYKI